MTVDAPNRLHAPGQSGIDPKYMTFVEHLEELRRRLIISVVAVALTSVAGWFLAGWVIDRITDPVVKYFHKGLAVDTVYGAFTLHLKVAIIVGIVFALPVILYEIWAFIAPAFGPSANRYAPIWIISALVLFAAGATTAYFVFPLALRFFAGFSEGNRINVIPFASQYISFITLILLVFGISYELPLVLVSLSAAGITSSAWLASKRTYAFFGVFVFSTVFTPGADWISPLILGGILYVLYELGVLVSRLIGK